MDSTPDEAEGSKGPAFPCGISPEMQLPGQGPLPLGIHRNEKQLCRPVVVLLLGLLARRRLGEAGAALVEAKGESWVHMLRLQPAPHFSPLPAAFHLQITPFHCQQRLQPSVSSAGLLSHLHL